MYAVVKTGGKQYKVAEGDQLEVEKLNGKIGDKVTLDQVLALGGDKPQIGAPLVKDANVSAEIIAQDKGDKVIVFKKKRRHNYRRKLGHRQLLTTLKITGIGSAGAAKKAATPKAEPKAETQNTEKTEKKETKAAKPAAKSADTKKTTAKKPAAKKPAAKKPKED